jgi:hypothetical protein
MLAAAGMLGLTAAPARSDTYTSYLVTQLRADPVYISAYYPAATPRDSAQIRRLLARVPLRAYVVADVLAGPDGQMNADDLAAVLHDQLGGGLFIMARDPLAASATGFGTSLPARDAMQAAIFELNGEPSLVQVIQRFTEILASGQAEQRLRAAGDRIERHAQDYRRPGVQAWQVWSSLGGGSALGAGLTLALLARRGRRRRARRAPAVKLPGVIALAGALYATLPWSPPAPGGTPAVPDGPDGVTVVARALPADPLYVDPAMAWMFAPAARARLSAQLAAAASSGTPVYVVAVPLSIPEDSSDYQSYFLDQLYRLDRRDGGYLLVGPSGRIFDAQYRVPRDVTLPFETEFGPESMTSPAQIAASTPERLITLVRQIAASPADPGAAGLPDPQYSPGQFPGGRPAPDLPAVIPYTQAAGPSPAPVILAGLGGLLLAGPLLALGGYAGAGARRRLRATRLAPAEPSRQWLRQHAAGELARLSAMIASGDDGNPGWERACDDYDAGKLAAAGPAGKEAAQIDLVGAIVLARDGLMALQPGDAEPSPPCQVNPLHGSGTAVITADDLPPASPLRHFARQAPHREMQACERCARLARAGASLHDSVLRVTDDGRRTTYYQVASVWRDRRFGASGPGLPQAVREHLGVE